MTRRDFVATAALPALAAATRLPIRKAVLFEMLPKPLSVADRFKLAVDTGFQATECPTMPDERMAEEVKKASEDSKLPIHSVMNMAHWKYPLSSADPAVVAESVKGMETSLRNAHFWGAETVLLVPAVVNPQTSYKDAWVRSQAQIRKLLPMAEELKVIIAVEEVWNKFLLSPLEYAKYIDDFESPWLALLFRRGQRGALRAIRRIGSARWASASSSCTSRISDSARMSRSGCRCAKAISTGSKSTRHWAKSAITARPRWNWKAAMKPTCAK